MFKYDSTHGVYNGTVNVIDESTLEINGKQIKVESKRCFLTHPKNLSVESSLLQISASKLTAGSGKF